MEMDSTLDCSLNDTTFQKMMLDKAHDLFSICDKEQKGFITKRDMQRLQDELPLSPEQLEDVFDSLDDDMNGFLTLEEFTEGFGTTFGVNTSSHNDENMDTSLEKVYGSEDHDEELDQQQFLDTMDLLGANGLFDEVFDLCHTRNGHQNTIKALWIRLRRDDPDMLSNFEDFLAKVSGEMKRSQTDFSTLEMALRSKTSAHDQEVRKLYEEMESQIKQEKDRILVQEKAKERQLREEMEKELRDKDQQLQDLLLQHAEMEKRLANLNTVDVETKQENERLLKEKESLQELLDRSQDSLEESKSYISTLRTQSKAEKRNRAMAALQISEGIAMERETLVKQLDSLRDMNKKLRDDKDEVEARKGDIYYVEGEVMSDVLAEIENAEQSERVGSGKPTLEKQGSVMSKYFDNPRHRFLSTTDEDNIMRVGIQEEDDDGIYELHSSHENSLRDSAEHDDQSTSYNAPHHDLVCGTGHEHPLNGTNNNGKNVIKRHKHLTESGVDISTDDITSSDSERRRRTRSRRNHISTHLAETDSETDSDGNIVNKRYKRISEKIGPRSYSTNDFDPNSPRSAPIGAYNLEDQGPAACSTPVQKEEIELQPERLFKIVFVGDSGVGKSSFIHRFCKDTFKSSFCATIGIDFQVKSLLVDGHLLALQLWDTAGQERFRSITKQYFRKADGVLIMYDVTSETSFTSVRNWMSSVQDGVEKGTVLTLIGNKTDLCDSEDDRAIKHKDGVKLAKEFGALYFEASAKSGSNVKETMHGMGSLLSEREDREIQNALQLKEEVKKKGCCN